MKLTLVTNALGRRSLFSRDLGEVSVLGSPFLLSVYPFLVRFAFCFSLSLSPPLDFLPCFFSLSFSAPLFLVPFVFNFSSFMFSMFFFWEFFFLVSPLLCPLFFFSFPCSVYDLPLSFFSPPDSCFVAFYTGLYVVVF